MVPIGHDTGPLPLVSYFSNVSICFSRYSPYPYLYALPTVSGCTALPSQSTLFTGYSSIAKGYKKTFSGQYHLSRLNNRINLFSADIRNYISIAGFVAFPISLVAWTIIHQVFQVELDAIWGRLIQVSALVRLSSKPVTYLLYVNPTRKNDVCLINEWTNCTINPDHTIAGVILHTYIHYQFGNTS